MGDCKYGIGDDKMRNLYFVACFLSVFLSGCIEPALSGQAREDYQKNINSTGQALNFHFMI